MGELTMTEFATWVTIIGPDAVARRVAFALAASGIPTTLWNVDARPDPAWGVEIQFPVRMFFAASEAEAIEASPLVLRVASGDAGAPPRVGRWVRGPLGPHIRADVDRVLRAVASGD